MTQANGGDQPPPHQDGTGGADGPGGPAVNRPADDHYQPWLKNQGGSDPAPGPSVARPAPLPTRATGGAPAQPVPPPRPAAEMSADELLARPVPMPQAEEPAATPIGDKARAVAARAGEAIERAELGRRARSAGETGADLAKKAGAAVARASRRAAAVTGEAARKAGERAQPALKKAGASLANVAGRGAEAVRDAASAGVRSAGIAARKAKDATPLGDILPTTGTPPPSQLDRLLDSEADGRSGPASGLPLFAQDGAPPATGTTEPAAATPAAAPAPPAPPAASPDAPPPVASVRPAHGHGGGGGSGGGGVNSLSGWARHPASWVAGGLALLFGGFLGGLLWSGTGERAVTERIVHDYLLNHPEIIPQAIDRLNANRAAAAIGEHRAALERPWSGAWAGAANGDVTLVVFTDYACTFCRASQADLTRLLVEDRNLKIVFRELPILSADSEASARLALVAARSGRYLAVHRALFAAGRPDLAARMDVARRFTVSSDNAALNNAGITAELRSNLSLARSLGIDGTPTFIIGDKMLTGAVGYEQLRAAIRTAREG